MIHRVALGLAAALAVSCSSVAEPDPIEVAATVQFVAVEGGCWSLVTDNGTRYEPVNLDPSFQSDGLKVDVTLRPRTDLASICQVGEIVEVESIRLRE
ncbi:MAG: hypothetical protein ACE5FP_02700 [Gemmatimonadota bacterium]